MFEFRPELVNDDDEEADDTRYIQGAGGDEVRPSFDLACWSYWGEVVEKTEAWLRAPVLDSGVQVLFPSIRNFP